MQRVLRVFIYLISALTFLFGSLHLLRVRSARGLALRSLKSFSQALSAFIALTGAVSLVAGLLMRAPLAALAAAGGALLSLRYVMRVVGQPAEFAEAYGDDWMARMDASTLPAQRAAMLQKRWQWRMTAAAREPVLERDLVYHTLQPEHEHNRQPLGFDLWRPPDCVPPTGTALIYIHGGGYFTSSKDFGTRPFFHHLASQGHLIMDIDYRLAPQADLFDMLSDVKQAVAWMKSNAVHLGADPGRIVLAGGSAGAHLALLSAYAPNHPRLTPPDLQENDLLVSGVVSYYGIVDLAATYRSIETFFANAPIPKELPENLLDHWLSGKVIALAARVRDVDPAAMRRYLHDNQSLMQTGLRPSLNRLLGGAPDEIPEVYELVSPRSYAGPNCPPTLFFQGAHDYLLPLEPARSLHNRLQEAGVPSIYLEFPQTEHTFDLFLPVYSPPAQAALYHTERFLSLL